MIGEWRETRTATGVSAVVALLIIPLIVIRIFATPAVTLHKRFWYGASPPSRSPTVRRVLTPTQSASRGVGYGFLRPWPDAACTVFINVTVMPYVSASTAHPRSRPGAVPLGTCALPSVQVPLCTKVPPHAWSWTSLNRKCLSAICLFLPFLTRSDHRCTLDL
jgi:hypothetical protein